MEQNIFKMGNKEIKCMYCNDIEEEENPILEIHSLGKRNGQFICFDCLKKKIKIILIYEQRLQDKT